MQIKSNATVKIIVPAVVIAGLAVGLKSCKTNRQNNLRQNKAAAPA